VGCFERSRYDLFAAPDDLALLDGQILQSRTLFSPLDRLLKGEISAKQYVKFLQQEARARRSTHSGSRASRRAGSA
jgi:hypothetical protein